MPKVTKIIKDVKIPVGGIDDTTGTIYEKEIRPDGNTPIYKEVNINVSTEEKEETRKTKSSKKDSTAS